MRKTAQTVGQLIRVLQELPPESLVTTGEMENEWVRRIWFDDGRSPPQSGGVGIDIHSPGSTVYWPLNAQPVPGNCVVVIE